MVKFTGPGRSTSGRGMQPLPGRGPAKGRALGGGGGLTRGRAPRPPAGGGLGPITRGGPRRGPAGGGTMQPRLGGGPTRMGGRVGGRMGTLSGSSRGNPGRVIGAMKKAPRAK
jgi:hypothetical protein